MKVKLKYQKYHEMYIMKKSKKKKKAKTEDLLFREEQKIWMQKLSSKSINKIESFF